MADELLEVADRTCPCQAGWPASWHRTGPPLLRMGAAWNVLELVNMHIAAVPQLAGAGVSVAVWSVGSAGTAAAVAWPAQESSRRL